MPTYQYRCADCGEERDVVQSFTDDAMTVCPACEGRFRKVFSAVGVVFKGSGFYRTDSRTSSTPSSSDSSKNGNDGTGSSSSDSSSESSSKSSDSGTKANSTGKDSSPGTKDSGSTAKQPSAA